MLSPEEKHEIEEEARRYPDPAAACVEALKVVQRRRGWVSDEDLRDVADYFGKSLDEVDSVATFYSLVFRRPVGRHVLLLCESASCWIMGCDAVRARLREHGLEPGQITADGRFTLVPAPCLGACERAPVLMIDRDLHTNVAADDVLRILEGYR